MKGDNKGSVRMEKPCRKKRHKPSRSYSVISCLAWALKKQWQIDRRYLFFIFAVVPMRVIMPLVGAWFPRTLIDAVGVGKDFLTLSKIAAFFVVLLALLEMLEYFFQTRIQARRYYPTVEVQAEMDYRHDYYNDYENHEKQKYREIFGYAQRDSRKGECSLEFVWYDVSEFFIHSLGIITYASLLFACNPLLLAVVVITSLVSYCTIRMEPAYYEKHKAQWEKEERKKNYLTGLSEDFSAAKDIRLYAMEGWLEKMMKDYQAYIYLWKKRCKARGLWASLLAGGMTFIQDGAAYLVLLGILFRGGMSVGDFVFYFGLVGSIAVFLQGLVKNVARLVQRADKIAYYRDFYDYPDRNNHGEGCPLPAAPVRIELRNVWYRYDGADEDTLKGIDLTIEAGESLALVGLNGAGKTTLVKLICGLYSPTKGEILVGGRRIGEYNIEEYYSLISVVFQEVKAVAFTIFEFVASADLKRTSAREDAVRAMKSAGIYEKVESLSNGMDTHLMKGIYDDGVDFSGGEMQKLVLARAIYKDGKLLVLDEPTAALDPIAENRLYLQYRALTKGKTSVYISHRFASTRFCDRIVLLEQGRIVESGSHEELMGLGGRYAELFQIQGKYYQEGAVNG